MHVDGGISTWVQGHTVDIDVVRSIGRCEIGVMSVYFTQYYGVLRSAWGTTVFQ